MIIISKFDRAGFSIFVNFLCHVTFNLAETSASKSRPSVPHGANLFFFSFFSFLIFGAVRYIKLALPSALSARKYTISYRILSYIGAPGIECCYSNL